MSNRANFSGLWIPLVTPFHDQARHQAVDHAALTRLVRHLASTGIAGFVACGSTAEAAALDKAEQLAVLDTVIAAAAGLPVVMGLSGYNLPETVAWVRTLASKPLAGLLVPAPAYIRPSQAGLLQWFGAIAEASATPLIVYDIPYRTGVKIELPTLLTLAQNPRIRAVKDCGGDSLKTQALIADGRLQVLAGEDAQIFSTVAMGGSGAIAASAHVQTTAFVQLLRLLAEGHQLEEARTHNFTPALTLWQALLPLIEATFEEPNPGPIKAMLAHQGWMANQLRAPMTPATPALQAKLETLMAQFSPQ